MIMNDKLERQWKEVVMA